MNGEARARDGSPSAAPACEKCGATDIATTYHAVGCSRDHCSCVTCPSFSHAKRRDEHLHRTCRGCQFDWTEDVLNAA